MGTIAEKLSYLNNTKQLLKDGINDLGGNIDSETTFREYALNLTEIYNDYPKVSDTGTEINLTDTKKGKLTIELNPSETSQESTTGKNLLKYPYSATLPVTQNGVTWNNTNGKITATGTATAYSGFSLEINLQVQANTDYRFYIVGTQSNVTVDITASSLGVNIPSTSLNNIGYIFNSGNATALNINIKREDNSTVSADFYPMLVIGTDTTSTDYEPYTGGIPAPNPDYPFPIHTVSGENNIKIENKNLFYYNKATQVVNNVNFVINEDKSIIANGTASSNTYWKLGELYLPRDGTYYISGAPNDASSSTYRATCYLHDENGTYLSAYSDTGTGISFSGNKGYRLDYYIYIANAATVTNKVFKPMVKQGSTVTEYTPHQEQNYVINLGDLEYCKIEDYKDQIFENTTDSPYYDNTLNENEWYMKKNIGKVVLNGSETWYLALEGVNTNLYYNQRTQMSSDVLSDYFTRNENLYTEDVEGIRGLSNNNRIWIRINKTIGSNVNNFKSWLSTHNTEVYYALNTSEYINITENYPTLATQLENLSKARSYDDETNISQTNNDLPFDMNVSALKKGE